MNRGAITTLTLGLFLGLHAGDLRAGEPNGDSGHLVARTRLGRQVTMDQIVRIEPLGDVPSNQKTSRFRVVPFVGKPFVADLVLRSDRGTDSTVEVPAEVMVGAKVEDVARAFGYRVREGRLAPSSQRANAPGTRGLIGSLRARARARWHGAGAAVRKFRDDAHKRGPRRPGASRSRTPISRSAR